MAGNSIRVSTGEVNQIAQTMDNLNKRLSEELREGQATVNALANVWEGEAAQMTIDAFDSFAQEYFQKYEDIINQYVQFLRSNIDVGYTEIETQNQKLADAFK